MFNADSQLEHPSGPTGSPVSAVSPWNPLRAFFGIALEPRVYARILYVWLAFPLGLAYFVALVTLLPLGAGLLLIWVGLLVLAFAGLLTWGLVHWERAQAAILLGAELGPARRFRTDGDSLWKWSKSVLASPAFWKGLAIWYFFFFFFFFFFFKKKKKFYCSLVQRIAVAGVSLLPRQAR